ncbi:NlpC/P60 family protein [Nocardioides sp. DS6]|uniref:NlpC/P60 family protein n=1 Tax=Nocardioides eburneus TaxID=3231482 RepID=A0ABV3SWW3_9ACTN
MAAVVGIAGIIPTGTTAEAKPSVKDVQQRVDTLYEQAEQASEHYNDARLRLKALRSELTDLKADQNRQTTALSGVREQLRDSLLDQFEGSGISAVGQAAFSSDPKDFLAGMTTVSAVNSVQGDLLERYHTQVSALDIRRKATQSRADQVAKTEAQLKSDKAEIQRKLSDAKELLASLQEKERQEVLSRDSTRLPTSNVPVSGRAAAAVHYAMAQVGKAYVYGAAGPSAFDCSGLTMMAWAQAGVALPHSSSAQYGMGPHIAESDLRPGDLVFYYSPISHVGMYIGNGLIVNAENPSVGVKVTGLHTMPYVGAVRPG